MASIRTERPEIMAHRGYAKEYPENTIFAFQKAAENADWIELDVRRSRDDEVMVFHDESLDRLTPVQGSIRCHNANQLTDLEITNSGETIPTLKRVFEELPNNTGVMIELKGRRVGHSAAEIAAKAEQPVGISSNDPYALAYARAGDTEVPLGLQLDSPVFGDEQAIEGGLDVTSSMDLAFVVAGQELASSPSFVEEVHERGLGLRGNAISECDEDLWYSYQENGVDHVVVDEYPEFL